MTSEAAAPSQPASERAWWLRTLLVLQRPAPVFRALRDDSDEAAAARQEPVTALVLLAGIALVLASPEAREFTDPALRGLVLAVWAFVAGLVYGVAVYWVVGAALLAGTRGAGSEAAYRQVRHVLAYAAVPLALSLFLLWPVRLALFGEDVFHPGGSDSGTGHQVFAALDAAFALWTAALVVLGIRELTGFSWGRALAACLLGAGLLVALGVAFALA